MKKRLLTLLLAVCMAVSLFPGLSMEAAAGDVINDWIEDNAVIDQLVDAFYNDGNIVYHGYCGDTQGGTVAGSNVQFDIYEVTNPNELLQTAQDSKLGPVLERIFGDLTEVPDTYYPDRQYYGVRIYGNGDMENYDHLDKLGGEGKTSSPWSGTLTLNTGETVDLEEKLVVAYIEGAREGTAITGVTSVGEDAFWGQDYLTAVFLGNSVQKIKASAFESCDLLAAINMPNALTGIEDRAFYACDKLTFLRARATKIETIGERAFYSCTFLADVELPYTLKTIGKYAFAWDRILGTKNLVLPNGLTTIQEGAFAFCTHIPKLTVPNSVTSIGPYAFLGAYALEELTFTPGDASHTQPMTIGTGAFAASYALPEVAFHRVQSIGTSAFGACESLQRVSFDETINRTSERAFTSMSSDVYNAMQVLIDAFKASGGRGDSADEDDRDEQVDLDYVAELDKVLQSLTGLTPLEEAAFSGNAPYAVEATEVTRTFPEDCIIHYPAKNYTWDVTADGKWKGYNTGYNWTGHFHEFEETTTDATCTEDGNIHRACTVNGCGYEEDEAIPALGHNYVLDKAATPTCTTGSANFYQCTRCGAIKVEPVDALGHDERNCVRVEPTCTTPGSVKGTCARCGEPIDRVIPPTGHNIIDAKITKQPTCLELGMEEGWCYTCGQYVQQSIPTIDHTLVTQPAIPATCTTAGKTAGSYCSVCGTVVQQQTVVPALGHNYIVSERVEPTATTDGHVTYKCSRCGDAYTETLPATGPKQCDGGASCPSRNFTDMPKPSNWAHAGLDYCVSKGIINGTSPTTVSPKGITTRAQLVTMLYRVQGSPEEYGKLRSPFTDTPRDQYYFNAVMWAYYNKIVDGISPTEFDPNSPVTREQMATILMRYTNVYGGGATGSASLSRFPDANKVANWSLSAMQWAVANGIIGGVDENGVDYLRPQGNAEREQVATILMRYELNIVQN